MDVAAKVVAAVLGFIAAVASYPYFDAYVVALLALAAAVAVGVLVYVLVERLIASLVGPHRRY